VPNPNDHLHRFLLERAGVSGVLVQLEDAWQEVAGRSDYPPAVSALLGQALAATAALTGTIKLSGNLSLHLRSKGDLSLLFTECNDAGRLRGLAQWRGEDADAAIDLAGQPEPLLAITIDNDATGQRQQGLVPVEHGTLAQLLEGYFERSEQLPSHIRLGCANGRAAALILQPLARSGGIGQTDPDGWNRACHLAATLSETELLQLPPEQVLLRLFHEEDVRLTGERGLFFGCQCSRERVAAVLRNLGRSESEAALQPDGRVEVTCEFCNTRYHFDRVDLEQVLRDLPETPGSAATH
jgi:molecular chaperone Hsp33